MIVGYFPCNNLAQGEKLCLCESCVLFFLVGNWWTDVRVTNSILVAGKLGMEAEVDGR